MPGRPADLTAGRGLRRAQPSRLPSLIPTTAQAHLSAPPTYVSSALDAKTDAAAGRIRPTILQVSQISQVARRFPHCVIFSGLGEAPLTLSAPSRRRGD